MIREESGGMCILEVASGWETLLDAESWEEGTALECHSWAGGSREDNARFHEVRVHGMWLGLT